MSYTPDENKPVASDELLWETVTQTAEQLPNSELSMFSMRWDVFTVRGKWFVISGVSDQRIVNLKVDPEDIEFLCSHYPSITPGFHMNKKHWISVRPGDDVTVGMVRELVKQSYGLVVASLPKSERPVDPKRFFAENFPLACSFPSEEDVSRKV